MPLAGFETPFLEQLEKEEEKDARLLLPSYPRSSMFSFPVPTEPGTTSSIWEGSPTALVTVILQHHLIIITPR